MVHPRLLFRLFSSFQANITIFTTNKCEKCPSSIQCWDSNPQHLEIESPPITTRPGLTAVKCCFPNLMDSGSPCHRQIPFCWLSVNATYTPLVRRAFACVTMKAKMSWCFKNSALGILRPTISKCIFWSEVC